MYCASTQVEGTMFRLDRLLMVVAHYMASCPEVLDVSLVLPRIEDSVPRLAVSHVFFSTL